MMTSFWNTLPWVMIDRIGMVLGIIAFFPMMWAVIVYLRRNRLLKKSIKMAIARAETHKPVYIELTGKNLVTVTAENYLRKLGLQGKILPFKTLESKGVNFTDINDVEKLKSAMINMKLDIMSESPECIHLFYSGPVAMAIVLGDIFSNCKNVYIYHKDSDNYQLVTKI